MKNGWILAIIFLVIGVGLLMAVGAITDFDFRKLNTGKALDTHTYSIEEPFTRLLVSDTTSDLRILPAEDGLCSVVCTESEDFYCEITVENGTLTVMRRDKVKWYNKIGIATDYQSSVTVYLPEGVYERLELNTASGDISLAPGLKAQWVTIASASGDLKLAQLDAKSLELSTTSGDQTLDQVTADNLTVSAVSGDLSMNRCSFGSMTLSSTSGEQEMTDSLCRSSAEFSSVSGNIRFTRFDAGQMVVSTTSGDVTGTLLTAKDFETNTISGDVWLKANDSKGEKSSISTVSGDIHLDLAS